LEAIIFAVFVIIRRKPIKMIFITNKITIYSMSFY